MKLHEKRLKRVNLNNTRFTERYKIENPFKINTAIKDGFHFKSI